MDDQKKKQIIVVGVLGAVLVGVLFYQLVLAGDPPPGSTAGSGKSSQNTSQSTGGSSSASRGDTSVNLLESTEIDIDELTQSVEVQPIDYSAVKIGRDPMRPLVGIPTPPVSTNIEGENNTKFTPIEREREVTGIIWDDVSPVAIIDNMVVPEGYTFADGVVVQKIEPTRVLLKIGDNLLPLEMKEF